jgi:hypothetical protein
VWRGTLQVRLPRQKRFSLLRPRPQRLLDHSYWAMEAIEQVLHSLGRANGGEDHVKYGRGSYYRRAAGNGAEVSPLLTYRDKDQRRQIGMYSTKL